MMHNKQSKNSMAVPILLGFFVIAMCFHFASQAEEINHEPTILNYSCEGSASLCRDFRKALAYREVQKVLLDIAASPRTPEYIKAALKDTGVTAADLQALDLVRCDGDRFVLAFSLFTREDMDRIRAAAEIEGKSLAEALISKRTEIENALLLDSPPGVDPRANAYFILGCVSLDWDGLRLAREKGYLTVPGENSYLPQAIQPGGGGSCRALYWGSHNYHSSIAITSFGDHHQARQALPDLLWRLEVDAPEAIKADLISVADALIRRHVGRMMIALRDADRSTAELAEAAGVTEKEAEKLISLLLRLNYISKIGSNYRAIIPVLTERDALMVKQLRQIGMKVMLEWFAEHYLSLSKKLAGLTPVRNGVPLSDGFYWVWHYIFGIANRELVTAGLFADPYDNEREFKGCIPAVYLFDVVTGPL
jgi:hypothetical protein